MKLKNKEIYQHAIKLKDFSFDLYIPVKIGFFLQKNITTILTEANAVEEAKINVGKRLGELNAEGTQYHIPQDKMELATQEVNDLFEIEQDLDIHIFSLSDFEGIELPFSQLQTIAFMI